MNEPLVSVICASYNQSAYIRQALDSVASQTYKNLEIVIWDDASSDDSVLQIETWITEHPDLQITFIKNEQNLGICKSLNIAFSKTAGKYIQLLALDDALYPDKLERQVQVLENSQPHDALVFSDAHLMNDHSMRYQNNFIAYHKHYLSLQSGNYFDDLLLFNYIPAMTILYKREVLEKIGPWDETLVYEDYDMLLRLAKKYDFIFDDQVSALYRFHEHNTHKAISNQMQTSLFAIYLKYINYNRNVNKFLLDNIRSNYLRGELSDHHLQYFSINKPSGWKQKWIAKRRNVSLYKLLNKLSEIKNTVLYS